MQQGLRAAALAVATVGCANFSTVDEACRDSIRGEKHGTEQSIEAFRRVTCYRRFVGLDQANLNSKVSEATAGHAQYLATHGISANGGYWTQQDLGQQGFTGFDAYDRLADAGYLADDIGNLFIWEVLLLTDDQPDREALIDEFLVDPFFRDVFLAPAWEAGGWSEAVDPQLGSFVYSDIVLYFPSGANSNKPVVYPADGQVDVPTSWAVTDRTTTWQLQALPAVAGFPITFTVGSNEANLSSSNPLGVTVGSSVITGPEGPVDHVVVTPGNYLSGPLWSTAILVPTAPLQPGTNYQVEASLSWSSQSSKRVELSFDTALATTAPPAGAALGRQIQTRLTPVGLSAAAVP